MNTTEVDTCHCLVRHPKSAKFLVVKHDESWSPPVLKFPLSAIDFRASDINQGMLDKYGLKTRVLRPLIRLNHFHCVELELAAQKPSRKLQAVWVDREEYLRTRTPPGDVPDAFEIWLDEQHEGLVPENRPPFHQPGWFNEADHWIHFELDKLGVQVLGSVEQFRVGWPSSCLMQVRTSQGYYFFKAGFGDQPVEAKLTVALARHWPDTVFMPVAVDLERNWMLNAGFFDELKPSFNLEQLPLFAQAMAKLQVESASQIDEWQNLDVKKLAEPEFLEFCAQGDRYLDRWTEGGGGLEKQELEGLQGLLAQWAEEVRELFSIGLPVTLLHPDFRNDNMVHSKEAFRIIDWSDTQISHPFLVLGKLMQDSRQFCSGKGVSKSVMKIDEKLLDKTIAAYLQSFAEYATAKELQRALILTQGLLVPWKMIRMLDELQRIEPMTPHYYKLVVTLQRSAREAIKQWSS